MKCTSSSIRASGVGGGVGWGVYILTRADGGEEGGCGSHGLASERGGGVNGIKKAGASTCASQAMRYGGESR